MKYFSLQELGHSSVAEREHIDNTIPDSAKANLTYLVDKILDPARAKLGAPITISSGYRSPALNTAIGGAKKSQHMVGEAADLVCEDMHRLWDILKELPFDQLIWESRRHGTNVWIHVSHRPLLNRGQVLKIIR